MTNLHDAQLRSTLMSERIRQRTDHILRELIASIEGTTNWTLENGYRNIIANMSIGLDGTFRNIIGHDAENLMKARITDSTVS